MNTINETWQDLPLVVIGKDWKHYLTENVDKLEDLDGAWGHSYHYRANMYNGWKVIKQWTEISDVVFTTKDIKTKTSEQLVVTIQ